MILLIGIGFLLFITAISYNSLVGGRNQAQNALHSIDVMLKKRFDMLPNLVATVQQYATHERELLTEVARLRGHAYSGNPAGTIQADQQLGQVFARINAVAEAYPAIKANENFTNLQMSIADIEEQISAARRTYNAAATTYNNRVVMFPTNIIAGMFSHQGMPLYSAQPEERKNVNVKDLFKAS